MIKKKQKKQENFFSHRKKKYILALYGWVNEIV
jgi:hypothetical protein